MDRYFGFKPWPICLSRKDGPTKSLDAELCSLQFAVDNESNVGGNVITGIEIKYLTIDENCFHKQKCSHPLLTCFRSAYDPLAELFEPKVWSYKELR